MDVCVRTTHSSRSDAVCLFRLVMSSKKSARRRGAKRSRAGHRSSALSIAPSFFFFFFGGGGGGGGSNLDTATVKKGLLVSRKAHFGDVCGGDVCVCVHFFFVFSFLVGFQRFRFSFFFLVSL